MFELNTSLGSTCEDDGLLFIITKSDFVLVFPGFFNRSRWAPFVENIYITKLLLAFKILERFLNGWLEKLNGKQ